MFKDCYKLPEITFTEDANDFVGLYVKNGELKISVPKILKFSEDIKIKKKEIILFLNSINLAKTLDKSLLNNTDEILDISWPFDSYIWIIEDFLNNGLYFNREKHYVNANVGKIEWKKTLKNTPLISNGNLIYTNFTTSKINPCDNYITSIYEYCLKVSSERIGWLFNFSIPVEPYQTKSITEMIYILKKEIGNTFDDVKRLRFKHMLKILQNSTENLKSFKNYIFGTRNYYYVFEKMIDAFFCGLNGSKKEKFNPKGNWNLNGSLNVIPSSNLRPDTIIKYNNILYIIDSKMYKFGYTGNPQHLPDTTSMQKQITYGDYVATKYHKHKIRNAFVLPFNKELNVFFNGYFGYELVSLDTDNNLQYLGYASTEWRKDSDKKYYDYIYTFLIDMNFLLCNYNKKNTIYTKLIIEKIEYLATIHNS